MFLVFALPCFFLVRERRRPAPDPDAPPSRPFAQLAATVRRARGAPHGRLLLARFFYVDAIATVLAYLTVYARRTGDFDGDSIDQVLALSAVAGIVGALGGGMLAERIGPRRVVLGHARDRGRRAARRGDHGLGRALVGRRAAARRRARARCRRSTACSCCGSCRPERRGEDFALYALVGKLSTGFGPLVLWGGTILVFDRTRGLVEVRCEPRGGRRARRLGAGGPADPAPAVGPRAARRGADRAGLS